MNRQTHSPVPLQIADVEAPGRLDIAVLHEWAGRLASAGCAESLRRAQIPPESARATASVLADCSHWQYPADALWFAASGPQGSLHACMSAALARAVVALCLGYESPSGDPLTGSDRRLLAHWLQPLVDGFTEMVGWAGQAYVSVSGDAEPAMGAFADCTLALFCVSLTAAQEHGTVHLAAPWSLLRPTVTRQVAATYGHLRIAPSAFTAVELPLEARIAGGTISVAETFDLGAGDVLVLDSGPQGAVELHIGGQAVAIGRLGSQGGKWAVRTTELRIENIRGRGNAGRHTGDSQ